MGGGRARRPRWYSGIDEGNCFKRNCGDAPRMGNFLKIVPKLGSCFLDGLDAAIIIASDKLPRAWVR
jgi:hypothetical protein